MMRRPPSSSATPAAVGAALRQIIRDAEMYQEDVARASGIPTRTFMRYLAGDSAMPLSAMFAMARGMQIDAAELAERIAECLGSAAG